MCPFNQRVRLRIVDAVATAAAAKWIAGSTSVPPHSNQPVLTSIRPTPMASAGRGGGVYGGDNASRSTRYSHGPWYSTAHTDKGLCKIRQVLSRRRLEEVARPLKITTSTRKIRYVNKYRNHY